MLGLFSIFLQLGKERSFFPQRCSESRYSVIQLRPVDRRQVGFDSGCLGCRAASLNASEQTVGISCLNLHQADIQPPFFGGRQHGQSLDQSIAQLLSGLRASFKPTFYISLKVRKPSARSLVERLLTQDAFILVFIDCGEGSFRVSQFFRVLPCLIPHQAPAFFANSVERRISKHPLCVVTCSLPLLCCIASGIENCKELVVGQRIKKALHFAFELCEEFLLTLQFLQATGDVLLLQAILDPEPFVRVRIRPDARSFDGVPRCRGFKRRPK
ncbi:hypothetical protein AQ713_15225 [Burkholderia pseudomallei]|nr:hypothetical protein AQ713_15225 [Burkholderia pseudomallei]